MFSKFLSVMTHLHCNC